MTRGTSWKVDHSVDELYKQEIERNLDNYDDPPPPYDASDNAPVVDVSDQLETPEEKRARKRSHWVAYTTMFVMSIGFSIVLSGVWPYLKEIDSSLDKSALGWVVAANPFGQMVASPLLGLWGNKAGSIRGACIVTVICFIGGNIMYATLYAFESSGGSMTAYYMMILSRFIVGVSSANVTLCRSYLAGSTTLKERTTGIAIIAASQALGFVVGPGIQAVLTIAIPDQHKTSIPGIVWDKYTAAGWVAALLGFINLVVVMPCIFQEFNIAEKERKLMNTKTEIPVKLPKPDYIGVCGILVAFFFGLFIYVLLETLAEPFVTDQYAVTDDYAMVAVGVGLMVGGLLSVGMYGVTTKLAKTYDERKILITMGIIPIAIGTFLYLPWGDSHIVMQNCTEINVTDDTAFRWQGSNDGFFHVNKYYDNSNNAPSPPLYDRFYSSLQNGGFGTVGDVEEEKNCTVGCPRIQEWCLDVPILPVPQLFVAFIITLFGFPVDQALTQAIFSKMLGPKPQGVWMGILTAVGSLARIMGPIFVSYVYTYLGPRYTFGILDAGHVLSLILVIIMYPRFVAMKVETPDENLGYDNKVAEDSV